MPATYYRLQISTQVGVKDKRLHNTSDLKPPKAPNATFLYSLYISDFPDEMH